MQGAGSLLCSDAMTIGELRCRGGFTAAGRASSSTVSTGARRMASNSRVVALDTTKESDDEHDGSAVMRLCRVGVPTVRRQFGGAQMEMRQLTPVELVEILARHREYCTLKQAEAIPSDADRADLSCADLRGRDLSGAVLADADCHDADFTGADLRGADLSRTNFFEANLSGCLFTGAILEETNFRCAKLNGSDFTGASLNRVQLLWTQLERAQFTNARLTHPFLLDCLAAGSVFQNSDLTGVVLKGSFEDADFRGAKLAFSTLASTFTRCDFTGADLTSAAMSGVFIAAKFVGAKLEGAELCGDLSDADFGGAELPVAVVRGSYLNAAAIRMNRWSDEQIIDWRKAGAILDDETLIRIGQMVSRMFDAEFVYAGEDQLGTYWNLYFINTSSYVLDEVCFCKNSRTNVQPGERIFLRRHLVECLWDTFWSAADYHIQIHRGSEECEYKVAIDARGATSTRKVRYDSPDPARLEDAMDRPKR